MCVPDIPTKKLSDHLAVALCIDQPQTVTTAVASQYLSMNFVEAVIHYGLPMSPQQFAKRVGRYWRYGRDVPCTEYWLEDESGSLPIEQLLRKIVQKTDSISLEMDPDIHALFEEELG